MRPSDVLAYRRVLLDTARELLRRDSLCDDDEKQWEALRSAEQAATHGEAYYVSADMTAVAIAAGKTMPDQRLLPGDLPFRNGFLVYDRPVGTWPFIDGEVPVVGFIWTEGPPEHVWETSSGPSDVGPDGPEDQVIMEDEQGLWRPVTWEDDGDQGVFRSSDGSTRKPEH